MPKYRTKPTSPRPVGEWEGRVRNGIALYLVEHVDSEAVIETFVIAARDEAQARAKAMDCSHAPRDGDRDYAPIVVQGEGGKRIEIPYRQYAKVLVTSHCSPGEVICTELHTEA